MTEYAFCLHHGHLTAKADRIAARHGAVHVNYTEPNGYRRGWFAAPNRGSPFDGQVQRAIAAEIERVGGIETLRYKRDKA